VSASRDFSSRSLQLLTLSSPALLSSSDYKVDAETSKALGAALKAGAAALTPSHAIDAAWGLALLSGSDKEAVSALFAVAAAAVQKDPTSVDVYQLGALYNAAVLVPQAKLPEQVCVGEGERRGSQGWDAQTEASRALQATSNKKAPLSAN
jgi:hypothetical protein